MPFYFEVHKTCKKFVTNLMNNLIIKTDRTNISLEKGNNKMIFKDTFKGVVNFWLRD